MELSPDLDHAEMYPRGSSRLEAQPCRRGSRGSGVACIVSYLFEVLLSQARVVVQAGSAVRQTKYEKSEAAS